MNKYNYNCPCQPHQPCDCMPDNHLIPEENQLDKCCSPTKSRCKNEWLDTAMLSYRFGEDVCQGVIRQRFIPGWLINYCVADTKPGDMGYPDPCDPNTFYEVKDGLVYKVKYCNGIEQSRKYIKKALIEDCAIESVSASKITNVCDLFKNNSLVVDGVEFDSKYKSLRPDGIVSLNPNVQFLDVVLTDSCQLRAAFTDAVARKAVLPSFNCIGDYNVANDTFTINLSKIVDGTTMRAIKQTGACDKLTSYTYTAGLAKGTGTQDNPVSVVVNVDNTMKGTGETNNPLGVRTINPSMIDSTGYLFSKTWNPQIEGNGVIIADIETTPVPYTSAARTTINFSWTAPTLPDSADYDWLAQVEGYWSSDINWANVRIALSGSVVFDTNVNKVLGHRSTVPDVTTGVIPKVLYFGANILPQQSVNQAGDSTGVADAGAGKIIIPSGATITGRIVLTATLPNDFPYDNVRIPNVANAPGATRWFNQAGLNMEIISKIKKNSI